MTSQKELRKKRKRKKTLIKRCILAVFAVPIIFLVAGPWISENMGKELNNSSTSSDVKSNRVKYSSGILVPEVGLLDFELGVTSREDILAVLGPPKHEDKFGVVHINSDAGRGQHFTHYVRMNYEGLGLNLTLMSAMWEDEFDSLPQGTSLAEKYGTLFEIEATEVKRRASRKINLLHNFTGETEEGLKLFDTLWDIESIYGTGDITYRQGESWKGKNWSACYFYGIGLEICYTDYSHFATDHFLNDEKIESDDFRVSSIRIRLPAGDEDMEKREKYLRSKRKMKVDN